MGMDDNMLMCIRALAENRIQDAKEYAIRCCVNDTTKKNESKTAYYKKLLENGSVKLFELPPNLKGLKKNQQNAWLIFACHNLKKMSLWRGKYRRKPSKNSIYPSKYTKKDNFISKIAYIQ